MSNTKTTELDNVVVRFTGDSGDGMQLTGTLFSNLSAILGNEISTFPDLGNSSMFLRNIIDSHFPPCYTQLEAARERLPAQKTAHEG